MTASRRGREHFPRCGGAARCVRLLGIRVRWDSAGPPLLARREVDGAPLASAQGGLARRSGRCAAEAKPGRGWSGCRRSCAVLTLAKVSQAFLGRIIERVAEGATRSYLLNICARLREQPPEGAA